MFRDIESESLVHVPPDQWRRLSAAQTLWAPSAIERYSAVGQKGAPWSRRKVRRKTHLYTIQEDISHLSEGDTIVVRAGTLEPHEQRYLRRKRVSKKVSKKVNKKVRHTRHTRRKERRREPRTVIYNHQNHNRANHWLWSARLAVEECSHTRALPRATSYRRGSYAYCVR